MSLAETQAPAPPRPEPAPYPRPHAGPPWVGPVTSRVCYERQFLWVQGAIHLMGPAHRLRVHAVALVHIVLMLIVPVGDLRGVPAVLAPRRVVVGEVLRTGERIGGPTWIRMNVLEPDEAIHRDDPHRVM